MIRCPNCDYDLRGLTEDRCPECGRRFSSREVATYAETRWLPQKNFRRLILATIPWFIAYFFVDVIHDTADRVRITWWMIPFLAVPIQLILAITAAEGLKASSKRSTKQFGAALTIIVWILILGHIALTLGTL